MARRHGVCAPGHHTRSGDSIVAIGASDLVPNFWFIPAQGDAILDTMTVYCHAVHGAGANSTLSMHTYKGAGTQRSDSGKETQGGLHSRERNDGWK
ncbi:hypothetical protein PAXRUDRAFT_834599 [Paxillus rubicundulus Ve08.2h10]|uniref:Uncharacterized protein n=1 Tax=Paxillus rubicundulus Ve08.2h10 TaxID=930991 RepID=A0A0D0D425_9AGAM|nr:hypothetical protein PAXRUDRAFT_834599 [Paxillus rubicundulus Ve08.2h10]